MFTAYVALGNFINIFLRLDFLRYDAEIHPFSGKFFKK